MTTSYVILSESRRIGEIKRWSCFKTHWYWNLVLCAWLNDAEWDCPSGSSERSTPDLIAVDHRSKYNTSACHRLKPSSRGFASASSSEAAVVLSERLLQVLKFCLDSFCTYSYYAARIYLWGISISRIRTYSWHFMTMTIYTQVRS